MVNLLEITKPGNGYALLCLYKITKNIDYLHQAISFVQAYFAQEYQAHKKEEEHPYSLYGGIGGMVCIMLDLLSSASHSQFPAFEDI